MKTSKFYLSCAFIVITNALGKYLQNYNMFIRIVIKSILSVVKQC